MPKTIEYPRTSYLSAWEVAEVVDDTGGKCSVEACARKLNRKVSGSFKAILGSAVKFGLLTSKRELLTTTNLFRRIKHAYDKQEEKIYHREAFLHPPLFSHICRKFRNRELPVHMFDVMLVREFGVEEINAQNVAKAFVEGARMVGVLDERNVVADIDQLTQALPRRDISAPEMGMNLFRTEPASPGTAPSLEKPASQPLPIQTPAFSDDAISSLFGLTPETNHSAEPGPVQTGPAVSTGPGIIANVSLPSRAAAPGIYSAPDFVPSSPTAPGVAENSGALYTIRITGPGIDTQLSVQEDADLVIVNALLDKIRKHLQRAAG